jgi:dynactin 1
VRARVDDKINLSRKFLRRIEELLGAGSALSADASSTLPSLAHTSHKLGAAAVKMADLVSRYCLEVRTSKQPFQLSLFLDIVQEAVLDLEYKAGQSLAAVDGSVGTIVSQLGASLASAMDREFVIHGEFYMKRRKKMWVGVD